jgi:hypothetical protein
MMGAGSETDFGKGNGVSETADAAVDGHSVTWQSSIGGAPFDANIAAAAPAVANIEVAAPLL